MEDLNQNIEDHLPRKKGFMKISFHRLKLQAVDLNNVKRSDISGR